MSNLTYLKGDATYPQGDGNKILPHCCNTIGAWGSGYVLALSKRWSQPEKEYHRLAHEQGLILGNVQLVPVEHNNENDTVIIVANMIAQEGIGFNLSGLPPIRYDALLECLIKVNDAAVKTNSTIHMPRIGAGLAGGNWKIIEKIIIECTTVDVFVYDLK